jgi:multidrug efflux system outer membrane protein
MGLEKSYKKCVFIVGLSAFALQSCVFHPPYVPPSVDVPDQWRFGDVDPEIDEHLDPAIRWWQSFQDPVLTSLIEEAILYNQDIKLAICRVQEYYALLGIAESNLYPQIYGNASVSKQEMSLAGFEATPLTQDTLSGTTVPAGDVPTVKRVTDLFSLNATLSYEIDLWGKIFSLTEAAKGDLFAQINVRRGVVLTIVASVATAYIALREFEQELHIALETERSYTESYRLAQLRFDEGLTSALEVKQSESQIALARARVVQARRAIARQENLVSVLVGHAPTTVEQGPGIRDWPQPFNVPAGLPSELLFQRPDIAEAEQQLIAANARIGIARADYFPSFSLTGLFGFESLQLKNLFRPTSRTWQFGGSLLQPLFTGWLIQNKVKAAEAVKCEAYYNYERVVLNAFREVEDALVNHRKAKELFNVQKDRVGVLKEYLDLAKLQYQNGQTDYLNVLDAERNLFDAELDMAQSQGNIFASLVDIYKALGGGWVDEADSEALSSCRNLVFSAIM